MIAKLEKRVTSEAEIGNAQKFFTGGGGGGGEANFF